MCADACEERSAANRKPKPANAPIYAYTLRMPELRQMRGDIMLFADFFLDAANRELDKRIVGFDPQAYYYY